MTLPAGYHSLQEVRDHGKAYICGCKSFSARATQYNEHVDMVVKERIDNVLENQPTFKDAKALLEDDRLQGLVFMEAFVFDSTDFRKVTSPKEGDLEANHYVFREVQGEQKRKEKARSLLTRKKGGSRWNNGNKIFLRTKAIILITSNMENNIYKTMVSKMMIR